MGKKIRVFSLVSEGGGKYKLKLSRDEYFGIKLGLLEAIESPKLLFIFPSEKMTIYTTNTLDWFTDWVVENIPSIINYTQGKDTSKESFDSAIREWEKMSDETKWTLLKTISYFGDNKENSQMKEILKHSNVIHFNWVDKKEFDLITGEKRGFAGKLNELLDKAKNKE